MDTTHKKLLRNYSIAWTVFLAIILAFEYSRKSLHRGVVILYLNTAKTWFAGENIYHSKASVFSFNYLPTSAVLFFAKKPQRQSEQGRQTPDNCPGRRSPVPAQEFWNAKNLSEMRLGFCIPGIIR